MASGQPSLPESVDGSTPGYVIELMLLDQHRGYQEKSDPRQDHSWFPGVISWSKQILLLEHTHTCTYAPKKTACKGIIYQQGKRPYPSNRAISETMLISTAMCNSRVTPVRMLVNVWSRNLIGTQKKQSPSIFGDTFFSSKKIFLLFCLESESTHYHKWYNPVLC